MPQSVRIAGRSYVPGASHGVAALLTAASWLLARLPAEVLSHQRGAVIQAIAEAQPLIIEVMGGVGVRIWSADRLLVDLPAPTRARQARNGGGQWAREG